MTNHWHCEHAVETSASPSAIWRYWADVSTWKQWNPGVLDIQLTGPFATDSTFAMTLPDGSVISSRLDDVRPNSHFVDETIVGDLRVRVSHRIEPAGAHSRIIYALEASGPQAALIGPGIASDFPQVLATLAALAES